MPYTTEPSQAEIDQNWENLKQSYLSKGFTEVEFLRAQLALANFGSSNASELKEARKRAFQAFPD